jgi:glycosyltransferase involved in cell wall biosynthesis
MPTKENTPSSISVIVPVYNVEKYIHKCIDSLLEQDISLEIILINDGSTDRSGEIIEAYSKKNKNIKVVQQQNKGLSATRNTGLQIASGEYISFVDSDDWMKKDSLRTLYNGAKANSADIVMGNSIFCSQDGEIKESPFAKIDKSQTNILFSGEKAFVELMKTGYCPPMVFSYIYKRDWLIQHGFRFEELLHEDELWNTLVLCHARRVVILDYDFYYYRQRENSIMQTLDPEKRISSLFTICDQIIRFANLNCKDNQKVFSWLYVKIYQLYKIAFSQLNKIRSSEYILPSHHLYTIFGVYGVLEQETRQICRQNYLSAKRELGKYRKMRISPWFTVNRGYNKKQILILFYNGMWGESIPVKPENIPQDCIITTDRKYLSNADAVVFHIPTLWCDLDHDLDKPTGQLWIAWSLESEVNYPVLLDMEFMDLFDMRMTYHQYADIIHPYYAYDYLEDLYTPPSLNKINKCCAIISSQFNKKYLKELMQYMEIDSYGSLFNNAKIVNDRGRDTKMQIYSKYKFVIAFENSIAPDYVTEKFFDPFLAGTVPVYMGAPNIGDYAPGKNSFIDVRSFTDPRQLADFMNACYEDDALYSQFFKWKDKHLLSSFRKKLEAQKINPFIVLCNKVKKKKKERDLKATRK